MKAVLVFVLSVSLIFSLSGCAVNQSRHPDIDSIKFYTDLPGVTQEEIDSIEAIKAMRESLSYAHLASTEAFVLPGGVSSGFTAKLCVFLSGFFGIEFRQGEHEWDSLIDGLGSMELDFTGDLTMTAERLKTYYMSHPIAERHLSISYLADNAGKLNPQNMNGQKLGFLTGTVDYELIKNYYPDIAFERIPVESLEHVDEMLKSGEMDAFVSERVIEVFFDDYTSIISTEVFPLVYVHVSMSTANPELQPFISVLNKYIAAGGIDNFYEFYTQGNIEYAKFKLAKSFSLEENSYLAGLSVRGETVRIAFEHENYPVSFYNRQDGEFQGFAIDIIEQISELTGIQFENVSSKDALWVDIMERLKSGEISMLTQLLYSDARKNDFLWSRQSYASSHYALISAIDYPDISNYQVIRSTVGLIEGSAHEDMYKVWFPDNDNTISYGSHEAALEALERNEIDLLMASEYTLLHQTNYREKPGYKVNIRFGASMDSLFGFNKDETELCSIIDKTLPYINTDTIVNGWTERIFDYSRKYTVRFSYMISIFAAALALALILLARQLGNNKRIRRELERKTTTLSTIFSTIPDMLFSKDSKQKFTSCNPSFERLAGLPESEIIGHTSAEVFASRESMGIRAIEEDETIMRKKETLTIENWFVFPDGSRRLFESIKSPLVQNGEVVGIMGISRDITEHKEAEEAAQAASKAKSAFLAHMSHEIRTPINAITGMAELILRENIPQPVHEYVVGIKQAGNSLLSIINDILDFSGIEAGALKITPAEYSFSSLINDVIIIIRMRVRKKPVRFTVNIDCDVPERLVGDGARIKQILLNVLGNAAKYTSEGFISLKISCRNMDDDSVMMTGEVSDSGVGIREKDMPKLFDNFVRIDSKKNKDVTGTGLGLAITRSLCQAMGGDISVRSEYGNGSTFTINIPQKSGSSDEKFAFVRSPEQKSVIIYEDRRIYAESIGASLDNLGVAYRLAFSFEDFCSELKSRFYPFIFAASALAPEAARAIEECGNRARLVLFAEVGEPQSARGARVLTLPAHSASIASILNDDDERSTYGENGQLFVPFSAPSANILVVDDLATNLRVTQGLLAPYQMHVDICESGAEAVRLVKSTRYDLVFMDHMMPEMDGLEATEKIRALEDGSGYYSALPIIALTANAVSGVREMFLQNGMNDFLSKPIEIAKLNNLLEKWIPADKKENQTGEAYGTAGGDEDIGFTIEGVDIRTGIEMTGGTLENYIKTLEIFHMDATDKISKLPEYLERGDIKLYTVCVHALKSALASIGAAELSEQSRMLEMAGINGDTALIHQNADIFLAQLSALLKGIAAAMPKKEDSREVSAAYAISELEKLIPALQDRDAGAVDDIMGALTGVSWPDESAALFKEISHHVFMFDYDSAREVAQKLLNQRDQRDAGPNRSARPQ